jgi:hypothetical protein
VVSDANISMEFAFNSIALAEYRGGCLGLPHHAMIIIKSLRWGKGCPHFVRRFAPLTPSHRLNYDINGAKLRVDDPIGSVDLALITARGSGHISYLSAIECG